MAGLRALATMLIRVPERHRRVDEQPEAEDEGEHERRRRRPCEHHDSRDHVDDAAEQEQAPSLVVTCRERPAELGRAREEEENAQDDHEREDGDPRPDERDEPGQEPCNARCQHPSPAPAEVGGHLGSGRAWCLGAHRDSLRSRTRVRNLAPFTPVRRDTVPSTTGRTAR